MPGIERVKKTSTALPFGFICIVLATVGSQNFWKFSHMCT